MQRKQLDLIEFSNLTAAITRQNLDEANKQANAKEKGFFAKLVGPSNELDLSQLKLTENQATNLNGILKADAAMRAEKGLPAVEVKLGEQSAEVKEILEKYNVKAKAYNEVNNQSIIPDYIKKRPLVSALAAVAIVALCAFLPVLGILLAVAAVAKTAFDMFKNFQARNEQREAAAQKFSEEDAAPKQTQQAGVQQQTVQQNVAAPAPVAQPTETYRDIARERNVEGLDLASAGASAKEQAAAEDKADKFVDREQVLRDNKDKAGQFIHNAVEKQNSAQDSGAEAKSSTTRKTSAEWAAENKQLFDKVDTKVAEEGTARTMDTTKVDAAYKSFEPTPAATSQAALQQQAASSAAPESTSATTTTVTPTPTGSSQ